MDRHRRVKRKVLDCRYRKTDDADQHRCRANVFAIRYGWNSSATVFRCFTISPWMDNNAQGKSNEWAGLKGSIDWLSDQRERERERVWQRMTSPANAWLHMGLMLMLRFWGRSIGRRLVSNSAEAQWPDIRSLSCLLLFPGITIGQAFLLLLPSFLSRSSCREEVKRKRERPVKILF